MNRNRRIALLFAVLFCFSVVLCIAVAKYVMDVPFTGNVTFKADLVGEFTLTESKAVKQANGTYLLTGEQVTQNQYILMPGVDVLKNPTVFITGKTAIPAYLYVEVIYIDNLPEDVPTPITYSMATGWKALGITGPHGGTVYVYSQVLDGTVKNLSLPIIYQERLTVSDQLPRGTVATMTFYGYMAQQVSAYANATETFTANFPAATP